MAIDGAKGVLFAISGGEDVTMAEIQEAANIITNSIDSEAKVIFGAIRDDDLRKNEIKITVVASGFPESKNGMRKNTEAREAAKEIKIAEKQEEEKKVEEEDNEEWDSVPAFLRRKK